MRERGIVYSEKGGLSWEFSLHAGAGILREIKGGGCQNPYFERETLTALNKRKNRYKMISKEKNLTRATNNKNNNIQGRGTLRI